MYSPFETIRLGTGARKADRCARSHLRICDLLNHIYSSVAIKVWISRQTHEYFICHRVHARPATSGALATTAAILPLLTNAQIARETSNDNHVASGHEAFAGME